MTVGQPAQQRGDVVAVTTGKPAARVGVNVLGEPAQCRPQGLRVEGHLARVGEHPGQHLGDVCDRGGVHRGRQLHMHPRLGRCAGGIAGLGDGDDVEQLIRSSAVDAEHRVHHRGVGDAEPVQQHGDRIHHHRGVVGDDLQRRPEPGRVVGRIHRDTCLADRAEMAEPAVRRDQLGCHHPVGGHVDR